MEVNVYKSVSKLSFSNRFIADIVKQVLKDHAPKGEVSVHCIGDARMKTLNMLYRGKDKTTDVLSFSVQEGALIQSDTVDLGDVFINYAQIKRQAKRFDVTFKEEFVRMLVHSVLHLLGHDHVKKKDAKLMFSLQEYYVKKS